VLAHVPGLATADYEITQVGHTVEELAELFEGAAVVSNSVGPCFRYAATVVEAALAAGVHYIDTGGHRVQVGDGRGGGAHRDRARPRHRLARDPLDVSGQSLI
jgi:saccharopine dehydrogenase-like NADP-dependent oxidoreductase